MLTPTLTVTLNFGNLHPPTKEEPPTQTPTLTSTPNFGNLHPPIKE